MLSINIPFGYEGRGGSILCPKWLKNMAEVVYFLGCNQLQDGSKGMQRDKYTLHAFEYAYYLAEISNNLVEN